MNLPSPRVKLSKITNLSDDIALALGVGVAFEWPGAGKNLCRGH